VNVFIVARRIVCTTLAALLAIGFSTNTNAADPRAVFARTSSSVVSIQAQRGTDTFSGSGVIVGKDLIVTNCHVAAQAERLFVNFADGSRRTAAIRSSDASADICLLTASLPARTSIAQIDAGRQVNVGDRVFAIGSPLGLDASLSDGLVSAIRNLDGVQLIQTTAPVSPGSSGGGLFNEAGKLIGITTFQFKGQNLNFAVPIRYVQRVVTNKHRDESVSGVEGQNSRIMTSTVAYKALPLGAPLSDVVDTIVGLECKDRSGVIDVCSGTDTYFGRKTYVSVFLKRDGTLQSLLATFPGERVGDNFLVREFLDTELRALIADIERNLAARYATLGVQTSSSRNGILIKKRAWRVGADEHSMEVYHRGHSDSSEVTNVVVTLHRWPDRKLQEGKDY
jgi:hypothetical protein